LRVTSRLIVEGGRTRRRAISRMGYVSPAQYESQLQVVVPFQQAA
jgi:hypothetical protein